MLSLFDQEMTMLEQNELAQHESVIERGIQTFVEVGASLMEIRDKRLYRRTHSSFETYCQERWAMSYRRANLLIGAANVMQNLGSDVPILPANEAQARPLTSLAPDDQRAAWQEAVDTAPDGKVTGPHVAAVAERYKQPEQPAFDPDEEEEIIELPDTAWCPWCERFHNNWRQVIYRGSVTYQCGPCSVNVDVDGAYSYTADQWGEAIYAAKLASKSPAPEVIPNRAYKNSSESNEWYTPRGIIEKAVNVMGAIDLDPASNEEANKTVQAGKIYTIEDNALVQPWSGRIWLNPPYGNDVEPFVDKLLKGVKSEEVTEALLLVAARTDTAWFRKLREYPRCFIWGRIKFVNGETLEPGDPAGFPSMVVYFGPDDDKFIHEFQTIGDVYVWVVGA